jgi:hypothetical protein
MKKNPRVWVSLASVSCDRCNGTGWIACPYCNGKGIFLRAGTRLGGGGSGICWRCDGKGVLSKCTGCGGTGKVDPHFLGMGPESFDFNENEITTHVEAWRIGNYAIGTVLPNSKFAVTHLGRSDVDLKQELLLNLPTAGPQRNQFKFSYAASAKEAYEKDCRLFHNLYHWGIDNKTHPSPPTGTSYPCPVPDCLASELNQPSTHSKGWSDRLFGKD